MKHLMYERVLLFHLIRQLQCAHLHFTQTHKLALDPSTYTHLPNTHPHQYQQKDLQTYRDTYTPRFSTTNLLQKMSPSVLLIGGHCDVQGVVPLDRMSLVDEAPGEIEQVALFQSHV